MRLISQDGNVDIPYDKAILLHAQDYVMARVGDKEYLMGEYSSMKKSYKAMEMMRKRYLDYLDVKFETFWYSNDYPKVFQFPKDEEMED